MRPSESVRTLFVPIVKRSGLFYDALNKGRRSERPRLCLLNISVLRRTQLGEVVCRCQYERSFSFVRRRFRISSLRSIEIQFALHCSPVRRALFVRSGQPAGYDWREEAVIESVS